MNMILCYGYNVYKNGNHTQTIKIKDRRIGGYYFDSLPLICKSKKKSISLYYKDDAIRAPELREFYHGKRSLEYCSSVLNPINLKYKANIRYKVKEYNNE